MTAEFIVSTLDDENDGDFSEGNLSLREAIALANDSEGADTTTFDSSLIGGTITLIKDQSTGRPTLANAPLLITDSVTINGLGEDNITIDGDNGVNGLFLLDGEGEEIDITIEDLTVANGAQIFFFFSGLSNFCGSFAVGEDVNLTLRDSLITGSSASIGGAIYNAGTVDMTGSTIENSSSGSIAPSTLGFGINGVVFNAGQMSIYGTNIADNDGGAITNSGTLEVSNSELINNSSDYGGGAVDNRGEATIVGTQMLGNSGSTGTNGSNNFVGSAIENSEDGNIIIVDSAIENTGSGSSDNNVILSCGTTSITVMIPSKAAWVTIHLNGNNDNLGDDVILGSRGEDVLIGNDGHDTLSGGRDGDIINGGEGNDAIVGGRGDDTLIGSVGHDTLAGNGGDNVFVLTSGNSSDLITDFADGRDLLVLPDSLSFNDLIVIDNNSNSGVLLLDTTNHDSVLVSIDNVGAADINAHDFTNL